MSNENTVSQPNEISLNSQGPSPSLEDSNALQKEKSKFDESQVKWNREKVSCIVSLISFALYVIIGGWLKSLPGQEIAANLVVLVSSLGMIQHWIYVLLKINKDPISSGKKTLSYFGVVVFAAIGACLYTFLVSRNLNAGKEAVI